MLGQPQFRVGKPWSFRKIESPSQSFIIKTPTAAIGGCPHGALSLTTRNIAHKEAGIHAGFSVIGGWVPTIALASLDVYPEEARPCL